MYPIDMKCFLRKGENMRKKKKKDNLTAFIFLSPSLLGFVVFMVYPFVYSIFISFRDWNMFKGMKDGASPFVGLSNYIETIQNEYFRTGLIHNFSIFIIAVPLLLILSLVVAVVLNSSIFARGAFRTVYFLPYVTTVTASAMVFAAIFHPEFGPINSLLRGFGVRDLPGWLGSSKWALPTIGIYWIWKNLGYCVLIYLSGLQGVDKTYYEAASIDGASAFQKFKTITFPLVSPTTFFLLITMGVFSLSIMAEVQVMTNGGPGKSTYTMALAIYKQAFVDFDMGTASSMAVIFFIIILGITIVQWSGQKKWVNY